MDDSLRLEKYRQKYAPLGVTHLLAIDEAGRGALAGPVSVGAFLTPILWDFSSIFLNLAKHSVSFDSKQLSPQKREEIYSSFREEKDIAYAVSYASSGYIDRHGISQAVFSALTQASRVADNIDPKEVLVLLDGALRAPSHFPHTDTLIHGDSLIPHIGLASIVAKVSRDKKMTQLSKHYPLYDFATHKGYGTKAHRGIIQKIGLSPQHRASFCGRIYPMS